MLKIILCVGIPGSGKSTWAKAEIAKSPNDWVRINNDDLRAMMNGSVWSADYEKMITDARNFVIRNAIKKHKNVIIDNLNLNRRHFDDVCKIVRLNNVEAQVYEKAFYIEIEEAIARDSQREGKAKVGETVIRKWWKDSGGKDFRFYKPRNEIIVPGPTEPIKVNPNLTKAIICDLDGTLALMNGRDPHDASSCEDDLPNLPVIETVKLFAAAGYKILFCSGRQDRYRQPTIAFIEAYCGNIDYQLLMRRTNDFRKDRIVKEEMFKQNIHNKYNVLFTLDDRDQVCELWRDLELTCFQVAPGDF